MRLCSTAKGRPVVIVSFKDSRKVATSRHRIGDGLTGTGCEASRRRALLRMDGGKCHSINDLADLLLL
jgi:hypothetical protein